MSLRDKGANREGYLSEKRGLSGLVLGDLVGSMLSAFLALAVGVAVLGDIDLIHHK